MSVFWRCSVQDGQEGFGSMRESVRGGCQRFVLIWYLDVMCTRELCLNKIGRSGSEIIMSGDCVQGSISRVIR